MEEVQEFLELGVLGLIKGAFKKKGILCAPDKKEIAVGYGLVELSIKLLGLLFEDVMAAGIKAGGIEGPHEGSDEINDTGWQGFLFWGFGI
jgi:hypothetical protein